MSEGKIRTLHPEGKHGVNISREKYEVVRAAIIETLQARGEMTFNDLRMAVEQALPEDFEGSPGWYYTTVKLDLEARDIIERVPGSSPQIVRLNAPAAV